MNADFDTELLSALLDGELSPVEASAVRQQLAESETLAAELATLESLSRAVQKIPPAAAPETLHANVLRAVELVPESAPAVVTAQQSKRGWTGVVGGLVAAIALCVVVVVSNRDREHVQSGGVAENTPSDSAERVVADSGVGANQKSGAAGALAPAGPEFRELEMVVDTGLIQQDAELVRVSFDPDQLHQQLMSARLSTRESSDAPEGYRAFVVEGSRSEINRVLEEFQRITQDHSIQIDRTNVPKRIVAEFQMEAQQMALIALDDRSPVTDPGLGSAKMKPSVPPSASGGGAFSGGTQSRSIAPSGRRARNRDSMPGNREPAQKSRIAQAKPESLPQAKDAPEGANEATRHVVSSRHGGDAKVLFFYKLPTESVRAKEPCAGA